MDVACIDVLMLERTNKLQYEAFGAIGLGQ
jgi:hypothetical protein